MRGTRSQDEPCDAVASTLQRWDGDSWAEVAPPDPDVPVVAMAVTDDGAAWALSYSKGAGSISRYADGRWTALSRGTPYPLKFSAGPRRPGMHLGEQPHLLLRGQAHLLR